jgi:hypothetical protein
VGATTPALETCDNVDNDCDTQTDEGLTRTCGSGVGSCQQGTQTCAAGQWGGDDSGSFVPGDCDGDVGPVANDVCNGQDDDCDGDTDDEISLTSGYGDACGGTGIYLTSDCAGVLDTCTNGALQCVGAVSPTVETCDGEDDDCDTQTDEGLTRTCGSDVGAFQQGTQLCAAGQWGGDDSGSFVPGDCDGDVTPVTNDVCNGQDDDCDGDTDDEISFTTGYNDVCGGSGVYLTSSCAGHKTACSNGALQIGRAHV